MAHLSAECCAEENEPADGDWCAEPTSLCSEKENENCGTVDDGAADDDDGGSENAEDASSSQLKPSSSSHDGSDVTLLLLLVLHARDTRSGWLQCVEA